MSFGSRVAGLKKIIQGLFGSGFCITPGHPELNKGLLQQPVLMAPTTYCSRCGKQSLLLWKPPAGDYYVAFHRARPGGAGV